VDIEFLRRELKAGKLQVEVVTHAAVEAAKDGIESSDIIQAIEGRDVIEDYESRALVLHYMSGARIPFHVVLEHRRRDSQVFVVTAYVPDNEHWEKDDRTRRRRTGRQS